MAKYELVRCILQRFNPSLNLCAFETFVPDGLNAVELATCLQMSRMVDILLEERPQYVADASVSEVYRLFWLAQAEDTLRNMSLSDHFSTLPTPTRDPETDGALKTLQVLQKYFAPRFNLATLRDPIMGSNLLFSSKAPETLDFFLSLGVSATESNFLGVTPLRHYAQMSLNRQAPVGLLLELLARGDRELLLPQPNTPEIRCVLAAFALKRVENFSIGSEQFLLFERDIWERASTEDVQCEFSYIVTWNRQEITTDLWRMFNKLRPEVGAHFLDALIRKGFRLRFSGGFDERERIALILRNSKLPLNTPSKSFLKIFQEAIELACSEPRPTNPGEAGYFDPQNSIKLAKILFCAEIIDKEDYQLLLKLLGAIVDQLRFVRAHRHLQLLCKSIPQVTLSLPEDLKALHSKIVNAELEISDAIRDDNPESLSSIVEFLERSTLHP